MTDKRPHAALRSGRGASAAAAVGAALATLLASACSSLPPYESTAAALARSARFSTEWTPLTRERDLAATLSDDERARREFWLSSCVNELAARFTPAPEAAVRALQIGECMEAHGWHLWVQELPALSRVSAGVSQTRGSHDRPDDP